MTDFPATNHDPDAEADPTNPGTGFANEYRTVMFRSVIIACAICLLVACVALARYGSIKAAAAAARGESVIVDENPKSVGVLDSGQIVHVTFRLANITDEPVRILGSRSDCTCVTTEDLPLTIGPKERVAVRFAVLGRDDTVLKSNATLLTNIPTQTRIGLQIRGRVRVGRRSEAGTPSS